MARDLTTRDPALIDKELATEGLAPKKKGQLRLEKIQALEDRWVQKTEMVAELEAQIAAMEEKGAVAPISISPEDASALGMNLIAAYLQKHGTNTRDLESLINNADKYKEAYLGFMAGGDFQTTYGKFKRVTKERDAALKRLAKQAELIRHTTEQRDQYKRDLETLGAPV